jgi:hypothetical protein
METIRQEAAEALRKAEEAERNSEYPKYGKAVYTELSQALENLAETLETPPVEPVAQNAYEIRKAARITRLRNKAAYLRVEAARKACQSHDIGRVIPFGQPILVGHHSERGHRNRIEKMHNASRKASELLKAADTAERSAIAAENSTAVSSDDPEALAKLTQKLQLMEQEREELKTINKLVKKSDRDGLKALGLSDRRIHELFTPSQCGGGIGIPAYVITNLGANIRRVKDRIAQLQKAPGQALEIEGQGFKVFEDAAENRVCFSFDGKPDPAIRDELKSRGFKWSPNRGLWVRMLNDNARWAARHAVAAIAEKAK